MKFAQSNEDDIQFFVKLSKLINIYFHIRNGQVKISVRPNFSNYIDFM